MNSNARRTGCLLCLILLPPLIMSAQRQPARTEEEPQYDSATVIAGAALVIEVREIPLGELLAGVHVSAKFHSEAVDIYLGPGKFLKQFEIDFGKGERLHIIGSRVSFRGSHVVLAREVRRGRTTVYLRDQQGHPNWNVSRTEVNPARVEDDRHHDRMADI